MLIMVICSYGNNFPVGFYQGYRKYDTMTLPKKFQDEKYKCYNKEKNNQLVVSQLSSIPTLRTCHIQRNNFLQRRRNNHKWVNFILFRTTRNL